MVDAEIWTAMLMDNVRSTCMFALVKDLPEKMLVRR